MFAVRLLTWLLATELALTRMCRSFALPLVCQGSLQHFMHAAKRQGWHGKFERLHDIAEPQQKEEPSSQPLTCQSAGQCLTDMSKQGLRPAVELMAGELKKLVTKGYSFFEKNRELLESGLMNLAVCFFKKASVPGDPPSRNQLFCYRVMIGASAQQLFWRLAVDEAPWVRRHADQSLSSTLRIATLDGGRLQWPSYRMLHQLCYDTCWAASKSFKASDHDIIQVCQMSYKRLRLTETTLAPFIASVRVC